MGTFSLGLLVSIISPPLRYLGGSDFLCGQVALCNIPFVKTLLILLCLVSIGRADFMQDRILALAGPMPVVTEETLPGYIAAACKRQLKDPSSVDFIEWTQPELRSTPSAGQRLGWWQMKVKVNAKNSYGGYVVVDFDVSIRDGKVTRCVGR